MATATTGKPQALGAPPSEQDITLHNVDWETNFRLRDEPANDHIRMAYLDGTLTLMSPEYVHDGGGGRLGLLIRGDDPTPDLAVEVDNTGDSKATLAIDDRLGVPEVWRYQTRTKVLWLGRLQGPTDVEVDRSVALPRLTPALVLQALHVLDEGKMGENAWLEWLKGWARDLPEAPANP